MTTTTTTRDDLTRRLRRTLANMRTVVRRTGTTGRNARGVSGHYVTAYGLLLRLEDVAGVEYAAPFGERLTALRIEAMERGLISPADVLEGETRAAAECPTPEVMRLLRDVRETLSGEMNQTAGVPEPKRTRVRVRTSIRPGTVERIGAMLTARGFDVEYAPHSTLYVERGTVVDAGEPVETLAVKMSGAAASELTMSVYDTMPDGAEPARVEVGDAVLAVPRRGGVVRLSPSAWSWLLEWLRAETEDRASSRYTEPEMFGAWRALVSLRARMEEMERGRVEHGARAAWVETFGVEPASVAMECVSYVRLIGWSVVGLDADGRALVVANVVYGADGSLVVDDHDHAAAER